MIGPQKGPQSRFIACNADIALYGGAAGGGKTFSLLLCPLGFVTKRYDAVIFRRTTPQIKNPGGLWDGACNLYSRVIVDDCMPLGRPSNLTWSWRKIQRNRLVVKFAHLEDRHTVYDWQGSQVPLIAFDELTHFEESQFWYMLSRNRSLSGYAGKVRATTNPDADSWVTKLVAWYLDEDGYPIPERAGVKRWMVRDGDSIVWADRREELTASYDPTLVMSFAFFPAMIEDNRILMETDPAYLARLNTLPHVERMRLRFGNWKVRFEAGMVFRREWFEVVDAAPDDCEDVRYWDRAATKKRDDKRGHDPDWTAGLRLGKRGGVYFIKDVVRLRDTPGAVQRAIVNTAKQDGDGVAIGLAEDPGQAGVSEADHLVTLLDGFHVRKIPETKSKLDRAKPVSAQAENGCIKIVRGLWLHDLLDELCGFPDGTHDDQCLISNTWVLCSSAWKRICEITTKDSVWTRQGLRRVLWSGPTGWQATTNHMGLMRGTPWHPVWTENRGWVPLQYVRPSDVLVYVGNQLPFEEGNTTATLSRRIEPLHGTSTPMQLGLKLLERCTATCGLRSTVQSRQECMYITRTDGMTTGLLALSCSSRLTTDCGITEAQSQMPSESEHGQGTIAIRKGSSASWLQGQRNVLQLKNGNDWNGMLKNQQEPFIVSARCADHRTVTKLPDASSCSVLRSATSATGTCTDTFRVVFNLLVEDAHEFFANGVLVHNCDALSGAYGMFASERRLLYGS